MHPRNFGNHVTVGAPVCTTGIPMYNNSINRYGNQDVTLGFLAGNCVDHPDILERKQQQSQVRLNKNVFTDVDNRERAKALDKKTKKANFVGRKT